GILDHYRLSLPRGVTIGGVVRDEQGRPIAGARVFPGFARKFRGGAEWHATTGAEVAGTVTDAEGRWRCEVLPATARPDDRLDVEYTHLDYFAVKSGMTAEEARKQSSVQVMKAGAAIAGTVLSPTGRPVAGAAIVVLGQHNREPSVRLKTDDQG